MNSLPLSLRMCSSTPRSATSRSITSTRSWAVSLRATCNAKHSRLYSSISDRMRKRPPLSVRSATKSQLQTWLIRSARVGIVPVLLPRRRGRGSHRFTRSSESRRSRATSFLPTCQPSARSIRVSLR